MATIERIPITEVLGDPATDKVKIEESWNKDVPAGERTVIVEPKRENLIERAIMNPSRRRFPTPTSVELSGRIVPGPIMVMKSNYMHFFSVNGNKFEYVGSCMVDVEKFSKDASGLFLRNWMKKEFPGRRDYDRIACFDDGLTMKEFSEMLGLSVDSEIS